MYCISKTLFSVKQERRCLFSKIFGIRCYFRGRTLVFTFLCMRPNDENGIYSIITMDEKTDYSSVLINLTDPLFGLVLYG